MSTKKQEKQAAIMQAITNAEIRIEHNKNRITELESANATLLSSIKLLKFELSKEAGNPGFGDSMNFAEDNIGLNLGCGHPTVNIDGFCLHCKEKIK